MTERLYYNDSALTEFTAGVTSVSDDGRKVYLNRTAFYPSSGGQPNDLGTLNGIAVVDVVEEEEGIAHILASPLEAGEVEGRVDWARRHDHMQQHSGQHLLSAVLEDLFGASTVSFHLGQDASTIELAVASLTNEQLIAAEVRANEMVWENRPVTVTYEDAAEAGGLRKASERSGTLRIVNIANYDRSACGGTHVSSTAAIGTILIRKVEKIRGNMRVEFLCGARAIRRTRADYEILGEIGRSLSSPPEQAPGLIANLLTRANDMEKARRKVAVELAGFQGRQLYETAGNRVVQRHKTGPASDELRALAQSFTSCSKAVFLAVFDEPPSVLLAVSKDSGLHAGDLVKAAVAQAGGRGGGNAQLAQGSVPSKEALEGIVAQLSV